MTPEEFDEYLSLPDPVPPSPTVTSDHVGRSGRTLTLGYDCERRTVHVYVVYPLIHKVIYISHFSTPFHGRSEETVEVISHEASFRWGAAELIPEKRAYPHATDGQFATYMRSIGCPLTFTSYNAAANSAKDVDYRGHVPTSLPSRRSSRG